MEIDELNIKELQEHPVWEFSNDELCGSELSIIPITVYPISSMNGRVIGTKLKLSGGISVWGILGNIDLNDSFLNSHFLSVSLFAGGKWLPVPRYHDIGKDEFSEEEIAKLVGSKAGAIFPISYDIGQYCIGDISIIRGVIIREPEVKLSRSELLELTFRS